MKILIPCAGRSSRFPNTRPKWMLTLPNGNLMVQEGVSGLALGNDFIVTYLKEHEAKYRIGEGLKKALGAQVKLHLLAEPTKSQAETVYQTIEDLNISDSESLFVKDSDNFFALPTTVPKENFVCISELSEAGRVQAANKSYVVLDAKGKVVQIAEKEVISSTFCVGGYHFRSVGEFRKAYEKLSAEPREGELYLSHIFRELLKTGQTVEAVRVSRYVDWGTLEDWRQYTSQFATYLVDIDGVLVYSSSEFFEPKWGTTPAIQKNVDTINRLKAKGNQIILLTARKESYREATIAQLKAVGLSGFDSLVMGCLHSRRYLINDFSPSTGYPSAVAINLNRDSDNLSSYLEPENKA